MKPLVSILIPAYNAGPWIAETIRSALAQTWPRKEVIVVDDGSRDNTLAEAQKFVSPDVTVVTQKNAGAAAARNKAYSLCRGDFVQWLDADDLLAPDKVERQMALAETADRRILFSSAWGRFMFRVHRAEFTPSSLWADLSPKEWLRRKMAENAHMQPATWLVSREICEAAGPWDERLSLDDDGEYFCRVLLASQGVRFVPEAKCFYRLSGTGSLSNVDRSDKKLESLWRSMQLHVQYLRSLEDSPATRAACNAYLANWLGYFHPVRPDIVAAAKELSAQMGGQLELPALRPKYSALEKILGRNIATRAQTMLPDLKNELARAWDKTLLRLGR